METEQEPSYFKAIKTIITVAALSLLLFVAYNIAVYTNSADAFEVLAELK